MTEKHISEPMAAVVQGAAIVPISQKQIHAVFGIQYKSLKSRGLSAVSGKYNLIEVYAKCKGLLFERELKRMDDSDDLNAVDLKAQKTAEEVRKLKIENDIKEGHLVYADDVAETYGRGIRAMCDVLDAMPSRLKMQNPDISSSLLDQINQELIRSRNMAADRLSELAAEESE